MSARILIADDEDSLRWVLEKGFRGAGYQVTAVKDGTAALALIEAQPFDLVLLDVRMPGIDGLTLLKQVRELENVIQRAMVMASSGVILPEHLPIGPVSASAVVGTDATLEDLIEKKMNECVRGLRGHTSANLHGLMMGLIEKPLLRAVMHETKGNQVRAAQLLGINRNTLRKKLKEHGIDPGVV